MQQTQTGAALPIVEAIGVSKRYGPTIALSDARLTVLPGESHALVGRNGAGKSTLVGILTGLRASDTGEVRFSGEPAPPISDREAWRQRVACVYQHSTIIPDLTVAENLFINRQPLERGFISWSTLRRQARELLDRWNVAVPEDMRAGDLRVEARQLVEIARALSYGARFIILDEPTAQLDGEEIKRLFTRIRELQASGVTFLFISHHLQEVYEICQAVTVLRDARHIITAPVADLPKNRLIEAMTGENVHLGVADAAGRTVDPKTPIALEVEGISGEDFGDISFTIRRGEVVGLSGSTSSGRVGVAEAIAGLGQYRAGTIRIDKKKLPSGDVPAALALGVGCVPKSRHKEGLILTMPIADNTTMTVNRKLGPFGFIPPRKRARLAEETIRALGVVTQGPEQLVSGLSGGNQQKVVMGRALANDPSVLVLMDPTAGVDVKSKEALLGVVERMRQEGKAILVVSSEVEDLRTCDRVLVMRHGSIVAEHKAGWSDNALVASIEGIEAL
ncbi:multidrug ABC transporter ATP-binding protein [Kaistia algarum]|uniref:sugar ABC transporter ATP-binding protein n=1 Tax=Kaistia algarum TaxID=2083279 RepID=UPI000CE8FF71|nr:sugar ABC transporter ATP-binding protein [Kaistia algarum]MCX5512612.1 sugar ABC transporter ATP-binding protein [Kaistia algarum]PPE81870.1 multidrug ABC transporter ATP-binding protein [Kaistia algarum]